MQTDVWSYREQSELGVDLAKVDIRGYGIEALDGSIGKVDDASYEVGRSYIVVDTGHWIFGRKVMLPAGVIRGVDEVAEKVLVNRTKDQIKDAPEFDESLTEDDAYRERLGSYYGAGGAGHREDTF
jgi:hypothetical protein